VAQTFRNIRPARIIEENIMISRTVTIASLFLTLSATAFAQEGDQARHKYFSALYTPLKE
jgi:hypothetical protein